MKNTGGHGKQSWRGSMQVNDHKHEQKLMNRINSNTTTGRLPYHSGMRTTNLPCKLMMTNLTTNTDQSLSYLYMLTRLIYERLLDKHL